MITAVVLTKQGGALLNNCLISIQQQSVSIANIIVVHSFPCASQEAVEYRYTAGYKGYSHAVNIGLQNLKTEYVFVLNDDTVLDHRCVEMLLQEVDQDTIVQPQIRFLDVPEKIENTGHWIFSDGFNMARGRGESITAEFDNQLLVFSGAAFLVHRKTAADIGSFDEDLFSFGEDLDWSLRAIRLGYNIRYVSPSIVWHKLSGSHPQGGLKKGFLVERNRICAMIRSWPRELILRSSWYTACRLSMMGLGMISKENTPPDGRVFSTALGAMLGLIGSCPHMTTAYKKRKIDQLRWQIDDEDFIAMIQKHLPPKQKLWNPRFF